MKSGDFILSIALITMLISAVSLGFTYFSVNNFKNDFLTGYTVTTNGTIYINITSLESFNLTTSSINWGSGRVNASATQATLSTSDGTVVNGSWTAVSNGFVLENNGNVNLTIDIKTGKNGTTFFGGTNPQYQYNVTNVEAGSCSNYTQFNLGQFYDVNITTVGTRVCSNLSFVDSADSIRIDVKVVVPYNSFTGNLSDQMQFTGTQSAG